ncbi:hypothetical protein [Streptomyces sp. NBC_00847]|uniref:hypothetical protein n=1 Tax=Streptomyces sp. NBC_00847 TaxID=2975850 RepID=UPI00225E5D18|nr:hypothetical protein [Streptomyces sp. NBC_00847]MCX4885919.1 hypothetical protein [Streptomyces sp. NBC_00847]
MTPAKTERPESNLVAHTRRELRIIGEDKFVVDGLCRVVQAFVDMGHSGGSAHFAALYLDKLLRFQPLSELTDDPGEWIDRHADGTTPVPLWQSKRNPEAFSTDGGVPLSVGRARLPQVLVPHPPSASAPPSRPRSALRPGMRRPPQVHSRAGARTSGPRNEEAHGR